MKNFFLFLGILSFLSQGLQAQTIRLGYPRQWAVLQRNESGNATVTVAGQLVFFTTPFPAGAVVSIRYNTVDASNMVTSYGSWFTVPVSRTGMFYRNSDVKSKGWHQVEVMYGSTIMAQCRFGVGDVYVIAGQSNAQGYGNATNWTLPSQTGYPAWIIGSAQDGNCTNLLPVESPNMLTQIGGFNTVGPTGNNAWCWANLAKRLSDLEVGLPIAIFNAASGGSTIKQWHSASQGQPAPNGYVNGNQFCDIAGTNPNAYIGQPYTPLKTALNYYASLFGIRAVLWHQGEADADSSLNKTYRTTSSSDYQVKLQAVIDRSRLDFNPNLAWIVARASISNGNINGLWPTIQRTRNGQAATWNISSKRFQGPDTDLKADNSLTTSYRKDVTHFENSSTYNHGLEYLGQEWFDEIGTDGFRISPGFVPNVTFTYEPIEGQRILTAPTGYAQYRWGTDLNNLIPGATSNVYSTYSSSYQVIYCFIKDNMGNWHVSTPITLGSTPGTRLSAEEKSNQEDNGLDFTPNIYPNPTPEDFTIQFVVAKPNSHVRLEIIDNAGKVVRTVVDNYHAKGNWKYPVKDFQMVNGQTYYCRLKVDDLFSVKKIVSVK